MTTRQLRPINGINLAALVVVAFLTRTTPRRFAGAVAGIASFGVVALGTPGCIHLSHRHGLGDLRAV